MGLCHSEPTVEVDVPGMPRVIYGNVDAKVARRIVTEHLISKALVSEHIFDKPAVDIIK
jgi:NADP-reducing hydrogenase subunit HndB